MKLIFATNNAHKLDEARKILPSVEILSLSEIGLHADIPETADTLDGNSLQKAEFVYHWCMEHLAQLPAGVVGCFADDTGLEIAALDGAPGVYTARWSGEPVDPARNRKKAIAELADIDDRSAQFRTVVTLIEWGEALLSTKFEGIVTGAISREERGANGFGYDPVFIPTGYQETFAELSSDIKNSISHRARAMQALAQYLHV